MKFYSLQKKSPAVDFKTAAIEGQAPDKGLYFPEKIPALSDKFINNLENISDNDIAFTVIQPYVGDSLTEDELHSIVAETLQFPIPLVPITSTISTLELFHGPTLAFKDVGARFMSRCLGAFMRKQDKNVTVLVATSGDTGGAVANGFYDVPGVEVVILYPSGMVSSVQEKQLTTLGKNIKALEVNGSFDDCQRLVKKAFGDDDLREKLFLTSANSINIARWLPQQFYYFLAYKQWKQKEQAPVICVPSGNFGNICAGVLAHRSGLPVSHFIAACNINDTIPRYLTSEKYEPLTAKPTLSNAMDVADPSNFIRIMEIFGQALPLLRERFSSVSVSDTDTLQTIKEVSEKYHYTLDPHGAVGYFALEQYLRAHPGQKGYFLETAHPVKFPDAIVQATGKEVPLPEVLQPLMTREKKAEWLENDYEAFKEALTR
jgi:threonine synthase